MQLLMTPGVEEAFTPGEIEEAFERHFSGDWGNLCDHDKKENEWGLAHKGRVMSVYEYDNVRLWIITDAGHLVTTALLPEEY